MLFQIRVALCELFISWSLLICPAGYTPSYVEVIVKAHKGELRDRLNAE